MGLYRTESSIGVFLENTIVMVRMQVFTFSTLRIKLLLHKGSLHTLGVHMRTLSVPGRIGREQAPRTQGVCGLRPKPLL